MKRLKRTFAIFIPVSIALLSFFTGGGVAIYLVTNQNDSSVLTLIYFSVIALVLTSFSVIFFAFFMRGVRKDVEISFKQRKVAEDALYQKELAYRQIFDGVNDAIFVETLEGAVLDVNERACDIFGWTREEFLTKTIKDMVPPEHHAMLPESGTELQVSDESFETINIRANGEHFPVTVSGRIQTVGDEERLLVVVRDISERKKAEEETQKLSRAITQSTASIVITDTNGTIEYVNPAFTTVSGYTREEALGNNPRVLKSGVHDAEFYKDMWGTLNGGEIWRGELCNKNKYGELYWEYASISPVQDVGGKVSHYVAVKENITERKKIISELKKAKEAAEAAAQAKADFLANMSHEIRTPLNAIYGMTSLMLDTPLNDEQQDFIETIRGGSDTLLKVINDILDFSKIEAGKMDLETQPFYVRSCVEEALDLLAEKAANKMLDLAYIIEDNTPPVVIGDITRLRQILVNLLNNAIKFTDKGEVVIGVKSMLIENDQYELTFSVRDTGIGIPEDKVGKLFKSFSQVDTSTTRKYGGTGLGLAISSQLTKNMGGSMWVESEEGKGSTFFFTIIVDSDPGAEPLFMMSDIPELADKRILLVDDNKTNRTILVRQTSSWGMRPIAVESGAAALDLLGQGEVFDIAILDMQMPGMDGFTLAQRIGEDESHAKLPLIILTSIVRNKVRAGDSNVSAFLNKPIKPSNLYNVLMNIIDAKSKPEEEPKKIVRMDAEMGKRHPLRVLLAEDNVINQKVALKLLSRLGYRADLAGNGIEVLEALERQTYDVIFMDIQMPEMDGNEATKRVREKWPLERQPHIIAMTAHALEGDRQKYLARGMDDYVSKPVRIEELVKALKKAKYID